MKLFSKLFVLFALLCSSQALALPDSSMPAKFPLYWGQNAAGSFIRPIPVTSQIGIQNGAASLNDGFPPLTFTPLAGGGVPPFGQDMNGILAQISAWSQWVNAGGPVFYDSSFSTSVTGYPKSAVLNGSSNLGNFWFNNTDNNTTNPESGGSGWVSFTPIYAYGTDSGSANAGVVTIPYSINALSVIQGRPISVKKVSSSNTGTYTLSVNGFSAAVRHNDGTALNSGDLPANGVFTVIYDGAQFQLQSERALSLGTAANKNASDNSQPTVASVCGAGVTSSHIAIFSDNNGTVCDGGANLNGLIPKAWVIFHISGGIITVNDSIGVSGVTRSSAGNYTVNTTITVSNAFAMPAIINGGGRGQDVGGSYGSGANPSFAVNVQDAGGGGGIDPTAMIVEIVGR